MTAKRWLILPFIFLSFLSLTACGFGGDEEPDTNISTEGTQIFKTSEIEIRFPQGWEVITPKDFTSDIPAGTLVGIRSPIKSEIFTTNVGVMKAELPGEVSSKDYMKSLLQRQSGSLVDFEEIERKEVDIPIGSETVSTLLLTFSGKETADADQKEFMQVGVVDGKTAYLATAAFLKEENEDVKNRLENVVRSLVIQ